MKILLHVILTILTGGLWLLILGTVALVKYISK